MTSIERPVPRDPYTVLAAGYDFVMDHVDYESWARHIQHLIELHRPYPNLIAELGCGTGSLAIELARLGFTNLLATDRSRSMLEVAGRKAAMADVPIRFEVADFRHFNLDATADVILLLYDGFNYLLEYGEIDSLLSNVYRSLTSDGVYIFDQSTPSNSLKNERLFEDHREKDGFRFKRSSRYDPESRLHSTVIEIEVAGKKFREVHQQRAYSEEDIRSRLLEAGFEILGAYDGFGLEPAHEESERIHWVVRKRTPDDNRRAGG